jgi:8-oxo-dGTP pyrophosphatase MutT (NUDIX family)
MTATPQIHAIAGGPLGPFEELDQQVEWEGQISKAGTVHYRFHDGSEARWDKVWHLGAVAMIPIDDTHVWLVRQPRTAAGLASSLEIPAGKRDVPGEPELETAKRELVEEIGHEAREWHLIRTFYPAPGWADEKLWVFLASGLVAAPDGATHLDEERLQIVRWPLDQLDAALQETEDAKTIIALQWLQLNLDRVRPHAAV